MSRAVHDQPVLVATVTVVFDARAGEGAAPEQIAESLLSHDEVTTVRIGAHGRASGYRVDVAGDSYEAAVERARGIAGAVACRLDVEADVLSVGLVRDDERVEVFRVGQRGSDPVWGTDGERDD
jgi:hypothetical protein